jgi:pimeloyl-ACP methyl ester carboxylesterase
LRIGTELERILANVRQFRRRFPQVSLAFSTVVSSATIEQIFDLVELGRDLGVSRYFFREITDYSNTPRDPRYTLEMPRLLLAPGQFRQMQARLNERWPTGDFSFMSRDSLDSFRQTMRKHGLVLLATRPRRRLARAAPTVLHLPGGPRIDYDEAGQGTGGAISPLPGAGAVAAAIPGARSLTIPRAGHLPNLEEPDAFNQAVRSFLQAL